jgi:uncharacterized protein (TIGR02145 family)
MYIDQRWNGSDVKHQGICPDNWHLPSDAEWTTLLSYAGGYLTAGTKLKSPNYWASYIDVPKGTDEYGFSALPGGTYTDERDRFNGVGNYGYWWSATETGPYEAWMLYMLYNYEYVQRVGDGWKDVRFSVRCVADGF